MEAVTVIHDVDIPKIASSFSWTRPPAIKKSGTFPFQQVILSILNVPVCLRVPQNTRPWSSGVLAISAGERVEPAVTTLGTIRQVDSNELEIMRMYLDRRSPVEAGSDVVSFTTMGLEHRDEFIILVVVLRSSSDPWIEGFSPLLCWVG